MRRLVTVAFWRRRWILPLIAVVLGLMIGVGVAVRAHDTVAIDHRICDRIDALDSATLGALYRSQVALPKNAYFKAHPLELEAAEKEISRQIRDFQGAAC